MINISNALMQGRILMSAYNPFYEWRQRGASDRDIKLFIQRPIDVPDSYKEQAKPTKIYYENGMCCRAASRKDALKITAHEIKKRKLKNK